MELQCKNVCIIDENSVIGEYLETRLKNEYNVVLIGDTLDVPEKHDVYLCFSKDPELIKNIVSFLSSTQVLILMSSLLVYTQEIGDTSLSLLEDTIFHSGKNAVVLRLGSILGNGIVRVSNVITGIFEQAMTEGEVSYNDPDYICNILTLNDLYGSICSVLKSLKPVFEMYDVTSFSVSNSELIHEFKKANVKSRLVHSDSKEDSCRISGELFEARYNYKFTGKLELLYTCINECLCCNSELESVLDLGMQILVNDYISENAVPDFAFPIHLKRCIRCFHLQLSVSVDPGRLFSYYTYQSGVSKTMNDYFASFAKKLPKSVNSLLEIASNDNSQLKAIQALHPDTVLVGVEPASNLVENLEKTTGITVINEFFGSNKCMEQLKKFNVIVAQNVFAHIPDPYTFLLNCKEILEKDGIVYIQTSQSDMIILNEFDTLYHEHISFFNVYSMKMLCQRVGLTLVDVCKVPVHGSSYIFKISGNVDAKVNDSVYDLLNSEMETGLYSVETYKKYTECVLLEKQRITKKLSMYHLKGVKVIGYGSTAKINVVINALGISNKYIQCIIDENPLKIGKYTSCGNIPIVSPSVLDTIDSDNTIVLILAWNFAEEIRKKIPNRFVTSLL
jgi:hypothetical protein